MSAPDRLSLWLDPKRPGNRDLALGAVARAPDGYVVVIRPAGRSLAQNARLHAMISEAVAKGFAMGGRRFTLDEAKTLFVSGWMIATKAEGVSDEEASDIVEGLGGEPVQLRRSTTTFSKEELGSLMDFVEVECAKRGIMLGEPAPAKVESR